MKTFLRIYHQLYENFMESLVHFVLRFDQNLLTVLIILHKSRSIEDECSLDITTSFLPGLLFVVKLEIYDENN